jgi:hypothetical protein
VKPVKLLLVLVVPALLLAQGGYYPRTRRGIAPGTPKPGAYGVAGTFHGKLKDLSNKEITIETEDSQIISIHRSRKTKFLRGTQTIKPSDIDLESLVTVDAGEEVDLSLTALTVTVEQKKSGDSK